VSGFDFLVALFALRMGTDRSKINSSMKLFILLNLLEYNFIIYDSFLETPILRTKWINSEKYPALRVFKHSLICSVHFQ
jgi:hypothetical protein